MFGIRSCLPWLPLRNVLTRGFSIDLCFFEAEELDFRSLSIDVVLRFLQSFVGLSESRIRTAVAAVKFFLKIYKRLDLVDSPLIDMFSKGAQNLAPIPQEKTTICFAFLGFF